jgi:dipeptidyl aminopeptidase/acylaminoacyl peptidase
MTLSAFLRNPGDLGLPYQDVEIASESGNLLRGWFIPPPERSDGRVGIFVHGANSSRFQALDHGAKFWYRRGYGLLTMDLSGRGTSEGEYITYTMNERKDVRSMLRWARECPQCAPDKVVLFGTSNGAASAIYAAVDDEVLPALALDAPYADLWDAAGAMLQSRGAPPVLRYPLSIAVRLRAGLDLRSVRPGDVITRVPAPVLFVHGDGDEQVPLAHSQAMHAAREAAGLRSELWVLPGGEHGFDNYPPEGIFWNRILDFFDRALGGPPPEWDLSS